MGKIDKTFALILILVMVISGASLIAFLPKALAQSGTTVTGIIYSDTTWTQANSPYSLTGPVSVNSGATLTIESGVTINLGNYYLEVNGTLRAIGNSNNINFIGGRMIFSQPSTSWNAQTGSGCIIENAVLSSDIEMWTASPNINNNTINNIIECYNGSPLISNNNINYANAIDIGGGSPVISNNLITATNANSGSNAILAEAPSTPLISDNTLISEGQGTGIYISGVGEKDVSGNSISGFQTGIVAGPNAVVERNLIFNNYYGIKTNWQYSIVENNTITENTVGVQAYSSPTFIYNNILKNTQNSIYSYDSNNINATYNWWGTTDQQAINQTIYDSKDNFNLGTVTFIPFLTASNPEAPNLKAPTPTPTITTTSIPTPTVPEFPAIGVLAIFLGLMLFAVIMLKVSKRKTPSAFKS